MNSDYFMKKNLNTIFMFSNNPKTNITEETFGIPLCGLQNICSV